MTEQKKEETVMDKFMAMLKKAMPDEVKNLTAEEKVKAVDALQQTFGLGTNKTVSADSLLERAEKEIERRTAESRKKKK